MPDTPPRVIAYRYLLLGLLGEGGMGRVWAARDQVLNRDVAIKELVPPPDLSTGESHDLRERVMREARAIARLDHRNVVRVFDVVHDGGEPWIVMELVPSRSLFQVLDREGPMPPDRVARIGLDVLAALRAAHATGLLHRDVKPANILLADNGRVVLTDFGLAVAPGDSSMTRTGIVLGSPSYLAPERALDQPVGPAADLWSLGATLYFAVEGTGPHTRSSPMATLVALTTQPPRPPRQAGALTPALEGLLRKDPAQRIDADTAERLLRAAVAPAAPAAAPAPADPPRPTAAPDPAAAHNPNAAGPAAARPAIAAAEPAPASTPRRVGPRWGRGLAAAGAVLAVLAVALLVGRMTNISAAETEAAQPPPPSPTTKAAATPGGTKDAPAKGPGDGTPSRRPAGKPPASPRPPAADNPPTGPAPTTKTSPTGGKTTEPVTGRRLANMMTGTCLDVPDGATTTADVRMWACDGTANQRFTFASDGTLRALGKCLQVRGTEDGSRLRMATCSGSSAQQFYYPEAADLVSRKLDKCVDVPDGDPANGVVAQIWTCHGQGNQKWHY